MRRKRRESMKGGDPSKSIFGSISSEKKRFKTRKIDLKTGRRRTFK
jgi:hypothetical protein